MKLDRLFELREYRDLKQKDIAGILKITQRTYSGYETGSRKISYQDLILLANFYNTSVDYILGLTDIIEAYPRSNEKRKL